MGATASAPVFSGDRQSCQAFLRQAPRYYIYVLRRPDGRPFYVGKGTGPRVFQHENEATHPNDRRSNAHKLNVIRQIGRSGGIITYDIDSVFEHEAEAYAREAAIISAYGRLHEGGPLTNRDPGGGEASTGPSPFSRARHAATLGGVPQDAPETASLNRFVLDIARMSSVVLKPMSRFTMRPTRPFDKSTRGPSLRQAAALAATAAANGIPLTGAAMLPRTVVVDDVEGFVENGVSRDIATSRMAAVLPAAEPRDEIFSLTPSQSKLVIELVGADKAETLGLIARTNGGAP